jgi:hypothetical protein
MIIAQQFIAGFQIGQRIDSPVGTAEDAASDVPSSIDKPKLLTYLRLSDIHLGLILNFHVEVLRDGISRVVNKLPEQDK